MVVSLRDATSNKKAVAFIILLCISIIIVGFGDSSDDRYLESARNAISSITYLMIYLGLVCVLMSSVTWKWTRQKNEDTNEYEFVQRQQETPKAEFNRRKVFSLGVFTSIYGAAMQVVFVLWN